MVTVMYMSEINRNGHKSFCLKNAAVQAKEHIYFITHFLLD
jgi:hypothetical protein